MQHQVTVRLWHDYGIDGYDYGIDGTCQGILIF